nr:hypothetical protein HK105_005685 [Polyrhizophydium stewartii]
MSCTLTGQPGVPLFSDGTFMCAPGTVAPRVCDEISSCPAGSTIQTSYNGIVACLVIDILLVAIVYLVSIRELMAAGRPAIEVLPLRLRQLLGVGMQRSRKISGEIETTGGKLSIVSSAATANMASPSGANDMEILVDAFRRALGGRDMRMNFCMENLGLWLPTGKTVLQGVSGVIRDSRMTAIMGPSGAGKTTFMNVLCGKVDRTSGRLWVSGREAEINDFKKIIGFVPQEDVMHRELTVRDNILHSARVRLPRDWTEQQINEHVDNLLKALNPIGDETRRGVSGGQRKRVNIGMELAAAPVCIFLDEPTSGLDSTSALQTADILKNIASLGTTVVAVIHQPRVEIFRKFDDVLMIAPGGRTAYLGPTHEAKPYFQALGYLFDEGSNEADTLMDILSGKGVNPTATHTPDDLVRMWAERIKNASAAETPAPEEQRNNAAFHEGAMSLVRGRGASFVRQVFYCHSRSLMQQYQRINSLVLEIFVGVLAGFLMGMASQGSDEMYRGLYIAPYLILSPAPLEWLIAQFGLLIGMAVALAAAPAGVTVFGEEKPVYWREASSGHSPLAYYIGKTIATVYRIVICSL